MFSTAGRKPSDWRRLRNNRICPVCNHAVPEGDGIYDSHIGAIIHQGACDAAVGGYRRDCSRSRRGRYRRRSELRRLIDALAWERSQMGNLTETLHPDIESLLWKLEGDPLPAEVAAVLADRLEELDDGRAQQVRQRLAAGWPEGHHDNRRAAIWGFWVDDRLWKNMSKERCIRAIVAGLLALFPDAGPVAARTPLPPPAPLG